MNAILQVTAIVLVSISALMSTLLFLRLRWPAPVLFILKLFASALSPIFLLLGVLSVITGVITNSTFVILAGFYVTSVFLIHVIRVTRPPAGSAGFERAFGLHWQQRIHPDQGNHFLPKRTVLRLPSVQAPRIERNVTFATIAGTGRKLLCDVWQPPENIVPSGLAFIYLHGGMWYLFDKDFGTRPLFNHLISQGHVIMDVAYRLAPETDIAGMVGDVKRAIVWMKENAETYGVNLNRIVLGGGSAGGHLALLTAYTANNSAFAPAELEKKDVSVCAVASAYGPTDLKAIYYHTNQHLTTRSTPGQPKKPVPTKMPDWIKRAMGDDYFRLNMDKGFKNAGALAPLVGGHPDECPENYALFSPVTHVHPGCPPTLLIHGEHDLIAPISATRAMYFRLTKQKIPVVMHILPQTDHAFDLIQPKISPSAHNAFYDIERFLALQVKKQILPAYNDALSTLQRA